jgi:hypothetical protein
MINNTFSPINPATANSGIASLGSKLQIGSQNGQVQANPTYTASTLGIKQAPAQVATQPSNKLKTTPAAPLAVQKYNAPDAQPVKGLLTPPINTTQYSDNGKTLGTQTPGMAGFNPSIQASQPQQSNAEAYGANGASLGTTNSLNSFPGLVGSLAGTSQQGSPEAQNYTNQTANYGAGNIPIGQKAQNIADQYGKQIAQVGGQGAAFESGQLTTGTSPVATGNAAVTAQTTAAQQLALATGEQAALQGIGYQLTGQNQAASAANSAAGQANTGQELVQSGLNQAATRAALQLGSIGQVPFSPLNQGQGQVLGSGQQGNIQGAGQLLGQFQGSQALGASTLQGQAQGQQALAAASGVGQAAGQQALAAAPGQTQASVYSTQQAQVAGYTSALQQGQNLQSQLANLIGQFGLNPNDLNAANAGIQKIAQNVSSPQYKILQNYVNDVANTYAQVLTPPGGSATDTTRGIASSMIDATASGQSLITVMQSLDAAAKAKIAGIPTTGAGNTGGSTSGSGSKSGFGWGG